MKVNDLGEIEHKKDLENLQVQRMTDPETNCDITIRSDKTMIVHFENSNLVLHSDGTRIL